MDDISKAEDTNWDIGKQRADIINWTLDKFHPYLGIKFVPIKETCINQILVCS